jgi:NAD(P)-dependent dehydrogenase (short-subunit alcohol dehydrogenase family)
MNIDVMSKGVVSKRLANKVCVVTGAAGGIGEATAERLASEGAKVVGVDLLEHSVGELALQADLTDEAQVQGVYSRVQKEFGRIDVLFNNAGMVTTDDGSALNVTLETWERVQATNLTTVFLCCKHGIPYLLDNGPAGGSVINTASFLAVMGSATAQMAYNAARAGVIALSRDLGVNLARRNVRVNALCIGPIETSRLNSGFAKDPEQVARRLIHIPVGRFGRVQEVAGTVAYLASDDAGYVTASAFPLDGGISIAYTIPS